ELEALAADPQARAAVAGLGLTSVVLPDRSLLEGTLDTLGPAREAAGRALRVSFSIRRLLPEWTSLKEINGELLAYDEAVAATVDIPLGPGPRTEVQQDRLRVRAMRAGDGAASTVVVELQSPPGARLALQQQEG